MSRHRLVIAIATLLAIVAGARTAMTYASLRSDLEELLPVSRKVQRVLGAHGAPLTKIHGLLVT